MNEQNHHILIVDDDPALRRLLREFWQRQGYPTLSAENGAAALQIIQDSVTGQLAPIGLVVLDIMMPGIDGIETCHRIRSDIGAADLPIIMLTARDTMTDRLRALDSGANDYLIKPFDLRELKARCLIWLNLREEIDRRARAELELRRNNEQLQVLYAAVDQRRHEWEATFAAIAEGISLHDRQLTIVQANPALAAMLKRAQKSLIGLSGEEVFADWYGGVSPSPLAQVLSTQRALTLSVERPGDRMSFYHLAIYPLLASAGDPEGVVQVITDISSEKRAEQQLVQSEKMAALGRMVASLAHEINNPLQALSSGMNLLLNPRLTGEKRRHYVQVASSEVQRLQAIVNRMSDFYRPGTDTLITADLNSLLDQVLVLTEKTLNNQNITVQKDLAADLPPCQLVPDQIKQVFLNLVLNAAQAMPDGGTLAISTLRQDARLVARFSDSGVGIASADLDRIFDPFFTTKPYGTGLGLAISYGIIQQHGGQITAHSEIGHGATFVVTLPIRNPEDESHAA